MKGRVCPHCHTVVKETTNTALFKRPTPHSTLFADFGLSKKQSTALSEALLELKTPKSNIVLQLLMAEQYETILGIHDHSTVVYDVATPLVRHTSASQTIPYSLYANEIRRLIRLKVPQKTGMGLDAILSLPVETYRLVTNACSASNHLEGELADELMTEINNS
jgi:hypothetical protein